MATTTAPVKKVVTFYRPHKRVRTITDKIVDHKTGEFIDCPSMTKQSFLAETDINNIMKQYSKTGQFNHVNAKLNQGRYADLPLDLDFQDAMNVVAQANEAFASLPSKLRNRFSNDPNEFLAFMHDPENQEEMYKLGLATRPIPVRSESPHVNNGGGGDKTPPPPPAPPAPAEPPEKK